jgi:hypothetical protein
LALVSASEVLEQSAAPRLEALIPWHRTNPSLELGRAYDAIEASLENKPPWRRATFSMIARVRSVIGNVGGADTPHGLELPAQGVEEIEHGVLAFSTIQRAGSDSTWLEAFLTIAKEREIEAGDVARAIWVAWAREERPEGAGFLAPNAPAHALFWSNVPGELLSALLADARRHHVPYEVFSDEQWLAFLGALARAPDLVTESRAFRLMPAHLVPETLELELEWSRAPESIAALWERFPALLSGAVFRELAKGVHSQPEALNTLLSAAPESVTSELLTELEQRHLGLAPSALVAVRALLRRIIAARGPNWRAAYRRLSELERELRRTQSPELRQ